MTSRLAVATRTVPPESPKHLLRCASEIFFGLREYQLAVADLLELGNFDADPF